MKVRFSISINFYSSLSILYIINKDKTNIRKWKASNYQSKMV